MSLGTIEAGQQVPGKFNWTPAEIGNCWLKLVVDSPDDINPDNNEYTYWKTVKMRGPDLGVMFDWIPNNRFILNETYTINAKVFNEGTAQATSSTASLYYRPREVGGNDSFIDTIFVGNVAKDQTIPVQFNWTPSERGKYWLKLVVDSPDDINPDNNEDSYFIDVVFDGPDLMGYFDQLWALVIIQNQTSTIHAVIYNEGTQPAADSTASLYYRYTEEDNYTHIHTNFLGTIEATSYPTLTSFNWTPENSGQHYLKFVVDTPGDTYLTNNEDIEFVNVKPNGVDLAIYFEGIWNQLFVINHTHTINASLYNHGTQPAANFNTSLHYRYIEEDNYTLSQANQIAFIGPDSMIYTQFNWTPTELGTSELKLSAEYEGDVNMGNNEAKYWPHVRVDGPDLYGWFDNIWQQIFVVNQTQILNVTVYNSGSQPSGDSNISLYYSTDFFGPYNLMETRPLEAVNVSGHAYTHFEWSPTEAGWNYLKLVINTSDDADPSNNEFTYGVEVYEEPLITQTIYLPAGKWTLVSFNTLQPNNHINNVFGNYLSFIDTVKTGDLNQTLMYQPYSGNNTLDYLDFETSYYILPTQEVTLEIQGFPPPEGLTKKLGTFNDSRIYNYFGYPYRQRSSFRHFFASILEKIMIIFDSDGNIYLPGIIDQLPELVPGRGYKIQLSEPVTFAYPKLCSDGTVSGQCRNHELCVNGQFVSWGCDVCGCPEGKTCKKIDAVWKCTGPDLPPRL
jgi:hypothetical protein